VPCDFAFEMPDFRADEYPQNDPGGRGKPVPNGPTARLFFSPAGSQPSLRHENHPWRNVQISDAFLARLAQMKTQALPTDWSSTGASP